MLKQEPVQAVSLAEHKLSAEELEAFQRQLKEAPLGVDAARAKYMLAMDQAARGAWSIAGEQWQRVVKEHDGSGWDRLAQFKVAVALEQVGDPARAFVQYEAQLSGTAVADLPERSRAACRRLIEGLEAENLRGLIVHPALAEFQSALRLRLMTLDQLAGRSEALRLGADEYRRLFPQGPDLDKVEALTRAVPLAGGPSDRQKVGLWLPLNGPLADFGLQVRRGAELALKQANLGRAETDQWKLVVADETGNSTVATENLRRLIEQEKVVGIVGPLGSDSAALAMPTIDALKIPVLSPTAARPDLANASPWFFRNCMTPDKQGRSMADYAALEMKLTRVASLASDKAYSQALARAFSTRFTELGGLVVAQVSYTAGSNDFKGPMLALGGQDPAEGKNAEQDEKRDQLARVEESSTALGGFLLTQASTQVLPQGVTTTPPLRVLVMDFAQDESTKALNAGRAFSDRFARTLAQLPELEVLGPQQAEKPLRDKGWDSDHLTPQQVAEIGKSLGVAFVLGGGTVEVPLSNQAERKEISRFAKARWFNVVAQLIDPLKNEVAATRQFQFSKFKAPPSNPLGLQAIYLPAPAGEVAQVVPSLRFYDIKATLLGSDLWDQPELGRHLAELEGARFSTGFWAESERAEVRTFTAAYKQAFAARPGLLTAQAYDATRLILSALDNGARDRASLREALAKANQNGVSGQTSFGGQQDARKRMPIIEIKGGQLKETSGQ